MTPEALFKRLRLARDLPLYFWKSSTIAGFNPAGAVILLSRSLIAGYWPDEAYRLGLLNPAIADRLKNAYCSKRELVRKQRRLNPPAWERLVADKGVFYRYCAQVGIPVPKLYAVFSRTGPGWTASERVIQSDNDWERFFLHDLPPRFIVKPATGHHGRGLLALERRGEEFRGADGAVFTVAGLVRRLRSTKATESLVVQERLTNHPTLKAMIAGEALTTSRIVTIAQADGSITIFSADLKIITGRNLTSNFDSGVTGNLIAQVLPQDGTLVRGLTVIPGQGYQEVGVHPETGVTFAGFRLPFWERVRSLVSSAAAAFLPVRTIGWDVAHTPDGPVVIEGNFWYDPPNQSLHTGDLLSDLEKAAAGGQ